MSSKLKETRLSKGLKSAYVAKRIGVSKTTLHQYELNAKPIKLATALRLSSIYDEPIECLFDVDELQK